MTHFEERTLTPEEKALLRQISRKPWTAKFHKTIPNETAPGGAVDMYILLDDDNGDQLVSIAVPTGQGYIANWIAGCCAKPWFIEHQADGKAMTEIAIAFNRALKPFIGKDGNLDGRDVAIAAMTIMSAYVSELPKYARDELTNRLLVNLNEMMRMEGDAANG